MILRISHVQSLPLSLAIYMSLGSTYDNGVWDPEGFLKILGPFCPVQEKA